MKNIIITLSLLLVASLGFSQVKVFTNGRTVIGDNTGITPTRPLDVNGSANVRGTTLDVGSGAVGTAAVTLNVGGGRAADGAGFIDFVTDVTAFPNAGFRFGRTRTGLTTLQHFGIRDFAFRSETAASQISFATNDGSTVAKRMVIRDNGNVGIGTPNPTSLLHVNGCLLYTSPSPRD